MMTVRTRLNDPDMWWQLKMGQVIWTTHTVPTTDLFSYTTNHHSIVPQEWLSETLIYGAYRLGGYAGLMLWLWLFTTLMLVAGYALCSLYAGNAKAGIVGAMLIWFLSTGGMVVRPQMTSYVLLVLELLLIYVGKTRDPRWFFGLPLLFLLWVNCHGAFLLGLIVLGVILFCSFCEFEAGALICSRWESGARRWLLLAFVISCAVLFVNPTGFRQVFYPLDALLHQHLVVTQIDEWKPLLIRDPRGIVLFAVLALVFLCLVIRRSEKIYLHELLLLAMGAWFALSHRRMSFAFGVFAAPLISRLLSSFVEGYDAAKDFPIPNAVLIALSAVGTFLAFPGHPALAAQVDAENPVKAVQYIQTHPPAGNMLNSYVYGGYLIWALPEHPVFIDGRSDLFEWAGVLREYGEWSLIQDDPTKLLDKYNIGFCLIERNAPMTHVFPLLKGWKQIYSDDKSVIFARVSAGN